VQLRLQAQGACVRALNGRQAGKQRRLIRDDMLGTIARQAISRLL
jgi:hypothetical protein